MQNKERLIDIFFLEKIQFLWVVFSRGKKQQKLSLEIKDKVKITVFYEVLFSREMEEEK